MRKLKSLIYPLIRPLIVKDVDRNEDFVCGYCCAPVLGRVLYCSSECATYDEHYQKEVSQFQDRIEALTKQIDLLKKESGITTLIRQIDKITKQNDSLVQEIVILRRGCDQIKCLDNPAMRWIHRALREADLIRGNRGH